MTTIFADYSCLTIERVINCNLSKASRILRILSLHAEDRGLKPSRTVYKKWGKGAKPVLRFSKYRQPRLEAAYSTHYVFSRSKAGEKIPGVFGKAAEGGAERTFARLETGATPT